MFYLLTKLASCLVGARQVLINLILRTMARKPRGALQGLSYLLTEDENETNPGDFPAWFAAD